MNEIMDPALREQMLREHTYSEAAAVVESPVEAGGRTGADAQFQGADRYSDSGGSLPGPAGCGTCRIWRRSGATSIPTCCMAGTWGLKAISRKLLIERDPKALKLFHDVEQVKPERGGIHESACGVAVFRGRAGRQCACTFSPRAAASPIHTFQFGRQPRADGLCLSDYILDAEEGRRDHLALFVVTAGSGVREHAERGQRGWRVFQDARHAGDRD